MSFTPWGGEKVKFQDKLARRRLLAGSATAAAGVAGLALVGCGGDDDDNGGSPSATETSTAPGSSATPGDRPAPKGSVTLVIATPIAQIDPFKRLGGQDTAAIMQMFDSLLYRDPQGGYQPRLATEVKALEGGKVYEFKLRDDVVFHNGDPMTAEDVKFSFDRILDPNLQVSWKASFATYESCEIVDNYTVRVHLTEPDGAFPAVLDPYFFVVPKKYIEQVGNDGFSANPVGTGPFKFVKWDPQIGYEAEAFTDYWGDVPYVQKLNVRMVTDPQTRLNMLQSGEADIVEGIPPSHLESVARNYKVIRVPNAGNTYVEFNLATRGPNGLVPRTNTPIADVRVRQAMNHAIDVKTIIDRVLFGTADQMSAAVAPGVLGYDESLQPYEYNPDKAKQLLSEAGFGKGDLKIRFNFAIGSETVAQAIADYLAAVGIEVEQVKLETLTLTQGRREATLADMFLASFPDYSFDPVTRVPIGFGSKGSYSNVVDEEMDRLLQEVGPVTDLNERAEIYRKLFKRHFDQAYYIYLWHPQVVYTAKKNVEWEPQPGWAYLRDANQIRIVD